MPEKNAFLSVLPFEEIIYPPELSSPPRFRMAHIWQSHKKNINWHFMMKLHGCMKMPGIMNWERHPYPSLGLLANGTLESVDLYRQLGELLGQNRTKIELKIESK